MSAQHTQGRLVVRGGYSIYAADGKTPVADACLDNSVAAHDEANARRLVACWNACDGISTEALEHLGTLDRARVQQDVIRAEAISQRDELLAATNDIGSIVAQGFRPRRHRQGEGRCGMTRDDIIRMARAAGFEEGWVEVCNVFDELSNLIRIAAAAEREECAKVCERQFDDMRPWDCAAAIRNRSNTKLTTPNESATRLKKPRKSATPSSRTKSIQSR